jgi:esterase/lipase superfamily enzyme
VAGLLLVLAVACAPRGDLALDPAAAPVGTVEDVIVASSRVQYDALPWFGEARAFRTGFASFQVSVPPDRKPGSVSFPRGDSVDPSTDFLVVAADPLADAQDFIRAVNRAIAADPAAGGSVSLFVHGYNTNFAEGLIRQAQIQHDLHKTGAAVQFAWPSKARTGAYLYDEDSVLFSRDAMQQTLAALAATNARRINLFGHSMGTLLVMDTLRGMAREGHDAVFVKLNAVVLIEADLDVELFRTQAPPVLARGVPIFALVSDKDRALKVSAALRGTGDRLGSVQSAAELGGLDVTVIDLTEVRSTDWLGHLKEAESPALIAFLDGLAQRGVDTFGGALAGPMAEGGLSLIQQGTQIVVAPLALR